MSFTKKFVAFSAAAALSATGFVAATGTSATAANVTKTVTYECTYAALGLDHAPVSAAYTIPAFPTTLPVGTAVPSKAISAAITVPASVSALVVAGFQGSISGTVDGDVSFGSQKVAASLTIPEGTKITDPAAPATLPATGTLDGFKASNAGIQSVKLPSNVTATLSGLAIPCTAAAGSDLSISSVKVGDSPALKAAKAQLAKDKAALAKAKKALKKAKGHKKVVLKKKVAKLVKKVKADQAKIKSLS